MKHTCDLSSRTLTLSFPGDVLSTNADATSQEVTRILESEAVHALGWNTLKLDLTAARMIDSVGLNLIVSLIKLAKNRPGKVVAQIASPNVQRTFIFTRLNTQMDLEIAA